MRKHYHIYDTCGEMMCIEADDYGLNMALNSVIFYNKVPDGFMSEKMEEVAFFNWANVVCVKEENNHDDDGDAVETPVPEVYYNA